MLTTTNIFKAHRPADKLTIFEISMIYEMPLASMAEHGCYRIEMRKHINVNNMRINQMNKTLIELTEGYGMQHLPCIYEADFHELSVINELLSKFIHDFKRIREEIAILAEEIVKLDAAISSTGLMY